MPERWSRWGMAVACLVLVSAAAGSAQAAPIGFNTALPLSKGELLWRLLFVTGRSGVAGMPGTRVRRLGAVHVVGYGVHPRLALFAVLPVADAKLMSADGRARSAAGIGDLALFGRWTVFAKDAPGRTWRIAPFFGVTLATGEHRRADAQGPLPRFLQPGQGGTDPFFGIVVTRMGVGGGFDIEWRQDIRGTSDGIDAGDGWRLNGSWQQRLAVIGAPTATTQAFVYGLIELGYERRSADRRRADRGILVPARRTAVVRPGLQFAARRFILEGAIELPFARTRIADVPRERWRLRAGLRMNF